jgi:hypothetical protein
MFGAGYEEVWNRQIEEEKKSDPERRAPHTIEKAKDFSGQPLT